MIKIPLKRSALLLAALMIGGVALLPQYFTTNSSAADDALSSESQLTSAQRALGKQKKIAYTPPTTIAPVSPTPVTQEPAIEPSPAPAPTSDSPRSQGLYVNPALTQAGRPSQIASQPTATWLGGWSGDVQSATNTVVSAATAEGKLATLVVYNIPVRDCGSYSAGGANSSESYKTWIRQVASGIGNRQAIVILEPDALNQITCLSATDQAARYDNLSDAVAVLSTQTKAFVYLDAGNSTWLSAATIADRLKQANIAQARGFSLNVSNFYTTAENTAYGDAVTALTGKPYVIDTSRNGNGSNGEWCNPRGRALGIKPTTSTTGNVDAYLWIKMPGESDGACNGGPNAGVWWEEYAQELIRNAQ